MPEFHIRRVESSRQINIEYGDQPGQRHRRVFDRHQVVADIIDAEPVTQGFSGGRPIVPISITVNYGRDDFGFDDWHSFGPSMRGVYVNRKPGKPGKVEASVYWNDNELPWVAEFVRDHTPGDDWHPDTV
jgi:hypothetical protein